MRCVIGAPWALDVLKWVDWGEPYDRWLFFFNYSHKVPDRILRTHECVNFHCTPLPYGRGGHPIENMILRGHTKTRITAHQMTKNLDAGPIYAVSDEISLSGTKAQILRRFARPCALLAKRIVECGLEPRRQRGKATYFKRLSPEAYAEFWRARG